MGRVGESIGASSKDPCRHNSVLQHLARITLPLQETRRGNGSRRAEPAASDPYGHWADSDNHVGEWGEDADYDGYEGNWEEKEEEAVGESEEERSQLSDELV